MAHAHSISTNVKVAARPSTVYRFLTEPQRFASWMGQGSSTSAEPGGAVTVKYPNGDVASGHVVKTTRDREVTFTYGYPGAGRPPLESTQIQIALREMENGTEVTLTHEGLPSEQEAQNHVMGWRHFLGMLAALASQEELGDAAQAAVDHYIGSWNEPDAARRAQQIERCWEQGGTYRDAMSYVEGRDHLNAHIGTAQMFAPGAKLEPVGGVSLCQGAARFGWTIHAPDGTTTLAGTCFGQLSLAGRFSSVVSFWEPPQMQK